MTYPKPIRFKFFLTILFFCNMTQEKKLFQFYERFNRFKRCQHFHFILQTDLKIQVCSYIGVAHSHEPAAAKVVWKRQDLLCILCAIYTHKYNKGKCCLFDSIFVSFLFIPFHSKSGIKIYLI